MMLSENEIERISRTITGGNRGQAEKLYLQDIMLSTVSSETVDELVFKGGTALLKFYQLDRFSEDLDFTKTGDIDLEELLDRIIRDLEKFGAEVEEKKLENSDTRFKARLGIRGPLYSGKRRSLSFIRIEVNRKSRVENIDNVKYIPKFQDINAFDLPVLTEEEILAEKIRAIRTRKKPRDLYDINFLVSKDAEIDEDLVNQKLEYYSLEHSSEETLKEAEKLRNGWNTLEPLIYSELPEFDQVIENLRTALNVSSS